MTTELAQLLKHLNYESRSQQEALFEHLITVDHTGVVAQAGTGVGKSIAVLAAAAYLHGVYDKQVLIVTPTRILMDQYLKRDAPAAAACFKLSIEELRGKAWYACEKGGDGSAEMGGCPGFEGGCEAAEWQAGEHWCEYRDQKKRAQEADIVVTNTDMLIVNDRLVPGEFFDPEGPLLVDEAHQLEPKLRDFSDRSLRADWLKKWSEAGTELARYIYSFGRESAKVPLDGPIANLLRAFLESIEAQGEAGVPERVKKMYESATKILARLNTPSENALVWCDGESLKLSWIDIAASARELLQARPFGLVSATIPKSMPSSLGVSDARIVDVGHPFDYAKQATLAISPINGAYQYAKERTNLTKRAAELQAKVIEAGGGALLLFSSFKDLEAVYEETFAAFKRAGFTILKQDGVLDNKLLGEAFKKDGNANGVVLFGSESFATGFDAPGRVKFLGIWKLPYPGLDPVTKAIQQRYYQRYNDMMLTRVTQAIGRLIRTTSDTGHVWIGDSRAEGKVLGDRGLMTKHLQDFRRI